MTFFLNQGLKKYVDIAQKAIKEFNPSIIVGSSMGGAVALNIDTDLPLVLIAPATQLRLKVLINSTAQRSKWPLSTIAKLVLPLFPDITLSLGTVQKLPPRSIILHSEKDSSVSFKNSENLIGKNHFINPNVVQIAAQLKNQYDNGLRLRYDIRHQVIIAIGKDHRCNDADPEDLHLLAHMRRNSDPNPLNLMARAVDILINLEY